MSQLVVLVGRAGQAATVKEAAKTIVSHFTLATNEPGADGEHTEWHKIVAFGSLANVCGKYVTTGRLMEIRGVIRRSTWEDKDGNKRVNYEIHAHYLQFLDGGPAKKPEAEPAADATPATTSAPPATEPAPRRRGRPPGSGKKSTPPPEDEAKILPDGDTVRRKRGRPKGSKNKPKELPATPAPEPTPEELSKIEEEPVLTEEEDDDVEGGIMHEEDDDSGW